MSQEPQGAKFLTKQELLDYAAEAIEQMEYELKRQRSPQQKRKTKNSIHFWKSLQYHLSN